MEQKLRSWDLPPIPRRFKAFFSFIFGFFVGLLLQEWRPFEAVRRLRSFMSKVQLVTKLLPADFHQYKFRSRLHTSSLLCRNHGMARCRALTAWVGLITSRLSTEPPLLGGKMRYARPSPCVLRGDRPVVHVSSLLRCQITRDGFKISALKGTHKSSFVFKKLSFGT